MSVTCIVLDCKYLSKEKSFCDIFIQIYLKFTIPNFIKFQLFKDRKL